MVRIQSKTCFAVLACKSDTDLNTLSRPELNLSTHEDKLVIVDEVRRLAGLLSHLRGLNDKVRRKSNKSNKSGQFLPLGSASLDLLKQFRESLAGRIPYVELGPIDATEFVDVDQLWVRGGFTDGTGGGKG